MSSLLSLAFFLPLFGLVFIYFSDFHIIFARRGATVAVKIARTTRLVDRLLDPLVHPRSLAEGSAEKIEKKHVKMAFFL